MANSADATDANNAASAAAAASDNNNTAAAAAAADTTTTTQPEKKTAPAGTGSNPPNFHHTKDGRTIPVPWWFLPQSARLFQDMELFQDDVIVTSGVKMGTTWVNRILALLLHEVDDLGNVAVASSRTTSSSSSSQTAKDDKNGGGQAVVEMPNRLGQTYPDACFPTRAEKELDKDKVFERVPGGREVGDAVFGDFVFRDLVDQPRPRMFTTHLFGRRFLPKMLFDDWVAADDNSNNNDDDDETIIGGKPTTNKGRGRLILVVRNPKDALCSLHHFRGTPADGWDGNEFGPGSFRRFLMLDDCPNSMGNAFYWIKENAAAVADINNTNHDSDGGATNPTSSGNHQQRALVVYYESLILNFEAQLRRMNDFLELGPLSEAKARAIEEACSLNSMQSAKNGRFKQVTRKGKIGDWMNCLNDEKWREFDGVFNKVLNGVDLAEPFRFFHWKNVPGMPLVPLKECDLNTDPRTWEPYLMVMLKEGMIVPDPYFSGQVSVISDAGCPVSTEFNYASYSSDPYLKLEETDSDDGLPRYHLFVAGSDPLASSVIAARTLLGLEKKISMDISDGQSGAGWVFLNGASCNPWKDRENEPFWLYEAYQLADPLCTCNITVPVLWDTVKHQIVSNDSWEILKLLSGAASKLDSGACSKNVADLIGKTGVNSGPTLFPEELKEEIERLHAQLICPLLESVEKAGIEYFRNDRVETTAVFEARTIIVAKLKELEQILSSRRFLMGSIVTGLDVCIASCLFQFDAAYLDAYALRDCKGQILAGESYPNLKAYTRDMYSLLKSTVHFESFRQLFRLGQAIEFTKQIYSCDMASTSIDADGIMGGIPDLTEIVNYIEKPPGDRPSGSVSAPAPASRPKMRIIEGVPMPPWFRNDSFDLFRNMEVRDDDIILSSGVKMGTTWVTKILNSLLYDFDENGNTTPTYMDDSFPNRLGQTYPDALYPSREIQRQEMGQLDGGPASKFGDFVLDDLFNQPSPRLFSSHLFGKKLLPKKLFDECDKIDGTCGLNGSAPIGVKGKGRLIVVVRNLKDTLASLHFFRGTPKDGWYGNEHGPGSFRRFVDLENCPNAYGNCLQWIKSAAETVDTVGPERALVIYYEALKSNFDAQVQRINAFLGLPTLTEAKARAISNACDASKMRSETGGRFMYAVRKGIVGDWANYLDGDRWREFDEVFARSLMDTPIADPLRFYQLKDIPGMPLLPLKECDLNTDPRTWQPYSFVTLREGMIVPDPFFLNKTIANSNVSSTEFKYSQYSSAPHLCLKETNSDGSPRYHLFVASECPLASSACATRTLLGLEKLISIDVSDGQSGAGWVFLNGASCYPWKEREGPFWLYEAYQLADPLCTTDITVPVLWDTVKAQIVSNNYWVIMKLISDAARQSTVRLCQGDVPEVVCKQGVDNSPTLFPDEIKEDLETFYLDSIGKLLDDVVMAGFECLKNGRAKNQSVLDAHRCVFSRLDALEELLGTRRFLLGNTVTGVDIPLAFFLFLFDACYLDAFVLRSAEGFKGPILTGDSYPILRAYARDMYSLLESMVHFPSFRQLFRVEQAIELSRQLYSSGAVSAKIRDTGMQLEMPNLEEIVASIEKPVCVRPAT